MNITIRKENTIKTLTNIGKKIGPSKQRFILGATALLTQPLCDMYNSKADNETKAVSVARTIAKIVAGTLVGVAVRSLSIRLIKRYSKYKFVNKNGASQLVREKPKDIFVPLSVKPSSKIKEADIKDDYENYVNTLGAIAASSAMVFTNFFIDAPLTKFLTKKLMPVTKEYTNEIFGGEK